MPVQYSIQKMVSDGSLSTITLGIQYLQRDDIYVRIDNIETPASGTPSGYTWVFIDSTTLRITPTVPSGVSVVVYRRTAINAMYNVYSQNAQFDEATVDENNLQLLYIAQEYLEQGIPGVGIDTIEFLRDDGTYTYYRVRRTDGSYSEEFYVPSASSSTRILARAALTRTYLEIGFNLVPGSFEAGAIVVNSADALLQESTGLVYKWTGLLPHSVPVGSTPESSGGIPPTGNWVDITTETLRSQLSSNLGADVIGTASGDTVQDELDKVGAEKVLPCNRAQPITTRSSKVLNTNNGIVILGDSISAGAYFGNAWTNGWPYLLAKAVNHHFGARNVGAIPTDSLYNIVAAYKTDQIHNVTWFGDWGVRSSNLPPYDNPIGNVGSSAGDAVNGKTVVSVNVGAYMSVVVPSLNGICTVYYVGRPDGGILNITVNGVPVGNINTYSPTKVYNKTHPIAIPDAGTGSVNFRLTKADTSPTELQAVLKYQSSAFSPTDHYKAMGVSNFSVSGRQLATLSEAAIIEATNCACLVLALGYNDSAAETDLGYYTNFVQNINWIIHYANKNKCFVVVNDFVWYSQPSSKVRTELKRVAIETNGVYIPFPDRLYPDGTIPVLPTSGASVLVDEFRMWADNAHPDFKGNEMIFHEVAKAMGLHITDKTSALTHDIPFPLLVQPGIKNKPGFVSVAKRTPSGVDVAVALYSSAGNPIPSGTAPLTALNPKMGVTGFFESSKVVGVSSGAVVATAYTDSIGSVIMLNTVPFEISNQFTLQKV